MLRDEVDEMRCEDCITLGDVELLYCFPIGKATTKHRHNKRYTGMPGCRRGRKTVESLPWSGAVWDIHDIVR